MTYTPTDWVDGNTPVDAAHMDKIEAALLAAEEKAAKGQANGYPSLGADGKVPAAQLPAIPPSYTLPTRLAPGGQQVADANSCVEAGFFNVPSGAGANTPDVAMHWFIYVNTVNPSYVQQIAAALYDNRIYVRRGGTGAWGVWTKVHPIDDANMPPTLRSGAYFINDWNTANQSGWYTSNTNTNGPVGAGTWITGHVVAHDVNSLQQTVWNLLYDPNPTGGQIWRRQLTGGVWGAWRQIWPIDDANLPTRLRSYGVTPADFNTIVGSGWYKAEGTTANAPGNGWGHLFQLAFTDGDVNYRTQFFHQLGGTTSFMRAQYGTWTAWVQTYPITAAVPARLGDACLHVDDWNLAVTNGFYMNSNGVNGPGGAIWTMGVITAHNTGYVDQTVWCFTDGLPQRRWRRVGNNFAWSSWTLIDDSTWQNFSGYSNNYSAMGAPWGPPQFRKVNGLVMFRGLVQSWGSGNTESITTIPAGYRPIGLDRRFSCAGDTGSGQVWVDAGMDGRLHCPVGSPPTWINLSDITYDTFPA